MAVNEGFLLGTYEEVYLSKFGRKLQIYNLEQKFIHNFRQFAVIWR